MEITYYGHSCFGVKCGDKSIVFDPFITDNPLETNIHLNEIPCDYILVSHGHGDHIGDVEFLAKLKNAMIVSCHEIVEYFVKKGLLINHPMNIGGNKSFDFGKVKMVNAIHSSSFPDGTYAGNPAGFVIQSKGKTFYYAGDTALSLDMKLIADEFALDVAFLPIGDNFTMNVDDAIKAANFVNCNKIIGMHYDTFGFIKINKEEAIEKFKQAGKELILLNIGQTISI